MHATTITEEQVDEVIESGDAPALKKLHAALVEKKQSIMIQLAGAKGRDLRNECEPDHDWRSRATTAQLIVDKCIAKVKARISELAAAHRKQRPSAPMRRVDVLRGTPDEIANELQEFLAGGWSATSTIVMPDGTLIAMFRGDYVPEAP